MLKSAVFTPIPSASVTMATAANPGDLRSVRVACPTSCAIVSKNRTPRASRHSSFSCSVPPRISRVCRRASSAGTPDCSNFSTCWSKWKRNSSSSSLSTVFRRRRDRNRIRRSLSIFFLAPYSPGLRRLEHPGHSRCQFLPVGGFRFELLPPGFRQFVVFRPPVVLRSAPARLDPPAPLQTVQRRIQRPLPHLQDPAGHLVDALGNGPTVLRSERQRAQNQKIERALRKIEHRFRHASPLRFYRKITPLLSKYKGNCSSDPSGRSALRSLAGNR